MGWGRQDRNKFLFRTLFLTHVGLSSHMQTWSFQKVLSLIARSPFSAVPGGHRETLSPLGKMSLREKKALPPISGFDRNGCWNGKLFVSLVIGAQRVWRGDQTPPSWLDCITAQGNRGRHASSGPVEAPDFLHQQRL